MNEAIFRTVAGDMQAEIEEKRSRFLAFARHVSCPEEAETFVRGLRRAHPTARHTVYAYLLRDGAFRFGDDGEPQGTAGTPTLEAIRRAGLVDVCVATVRYFGGILLGTGGLSRAYAAAARAALAGAEVAEYIPFAGFSIVCGYADHPKLTQELARFGGRAADVTFDADVTLACLVPVAAADDFAVRVRDLTAGRAAAERTGIVFERK